MIAALIKVNGQLFRGWSAIRITRSLEQVASSFSFTVTDKIGGAASMIPIKAGDMCQVQVDDGTPWGGDTLLAGFVDDRSVNYDAESHGVTLVGRSFTGQLVDCSAKVQQLNQQTLHQIAGTLCEPFKVGVIAEANVGKPFEKVVIEPGQSVFDVLSSLAVQRGVLLTCDEAGSLLLATASDFPSRGEIIYGENILACNLTDSIRDRYSAYTALNQTGQSDTNYGESATQIKATSVDKNITSHRPLTLYAEDGVDVQKKADFERNVRAGRAGSITYTVDDWYADGDFLWQPNTIVKVTDPLQYPALDKHPMLISAVSFLQDDQGTRTELTVVEPSAYDVLAVPEKAAGATW